MGKKELLSAQTDDDFSKARNKAFFNEIQHLLNPEETKLISFTDIKKLLKPSNEVYKGMQVVPISKIVGSEGRYQDFDNHFFPKSNFLKNRWESVDMAHLTDVVLPPIAVYELGGLYFVRDGNHRVSVAKMRGVETIDAEVVSLQTEIKLKSGTTKEQMIRQVIEYEKRIFYAETGFGDITDCWTLDFNTPGQYDVIYNHILVHKYYLNSFFPDELPLSEAVMSWYENVYQPVIWTIDNEKMLRNFKGNTKTELYIYLIKYFDELKQKFGEEISLEEAARDLKNVAGKPTLSQKIKNTLAKKKIQKETKNSKKT